MQKGLFGIESEQERKAKESRQLEHNVKTIAGSLLAANSCGLVR